MVNAYLTIINSESSLVNFETFNVGFDNMAVLDIAKIIKKELNENIEIELKKSDDNRSYHITSEKIKKILNFENKKTIKNAIEDLNKSFKKKLFVNSLENEMYFNIKRMKSINLK